MSGRIPQYFIDDLLNRLDIVDIIDHRIKLKKTGRNYSACCPFHQEKSPSFSVSPDKQFYYCFGCGASGNAIGFLMEYEHLEFPQAVESLAGQLGLEVPREESTFKRQEPDYTDLYTLTSQCVDFYTQQLTDHPQAQRAVNYLKHRGLDAKTVQHFNIGFAPPGWDNLMTTLGGSTDKDQKLMTAGMLVHNEEKDTIYDRFRDRIIFPIRDARGRHIAFGGRVLGDEKPKYLNSPETPIFHKGKELYGLYEARQANRHLSQIIVVEGYMDVVGLAQQGVTNAVATLGTATTGDHMHRLLKLVPEVVFCFDGDDAGRRAAWRALESTLPHMTDGRQARFLFLPQGEDPDSIVRKEGADAFRHRLKTEALSLDSLLFRELERDVDLSTMDGRARLAKELLPFIDQLPQGMFRQLVLQKLADCTGLETNYLQDHVEQLHQAAQQQATQKARPEPSSQQPEAAPHPDDYAPSQASYEPANQRGNGWNNNRPFSKPVQTLKGAKLGSAGYAIRQLLCDPSFSKEVAEPFEDLRLESDSDSMLLVQLIRTLKQKPDLRTSSLLAQWYGTPEGERLNAIAALDYGTTAHLSEFVDTLAAIRRKHHEAAQKNRYQTLLQSLHNKKPGQLDAQIREEFAALQKSLAQTQQGVAQGGEKITNVGAQNKIVDELDKK